MIHETAVIGEHVVIHPGTEIGAGCVIQDGAILGKPPKLSQSSTAAGGRPSRTALPAT